MQHLTGVRRLAVFAVAALVTYGVTPAGAETLGPVTDDIGVVKIPKGAPIVIGGYWTLSGPDTALGLDQKRAVEVAFDDRNNEVAGHPIRFIAEDGQCNAEGGQTAATKLASNQQMVVVVGPDCSSSATPGAPILWKAGIPSVATSTTAPSLTAPDRKEGYFGYLRTVYNDLAQGSADAEYFYNELGCRTLATVHDGSPYAEQLVRVAENRFTELGGKVTAAEAVAPTDVDMRPLLTGIATTKPCAIYFPIFVAAAAQIARQAPEISGLEDSNIVGGSALMAPGFLEAAGDAAVGFRFTNPDTSTDAFGKRYPEFVEKYKAKFGEAPIQAFHANAYDGGAITLMAIEKVAKKDDEGNTYIGRKALRDALFATAGYDGIGGEITCNEHGDCAGFKFAVYEFTDGDASTFKIGENPKKIFP
ncbi:MAG: branched-chain amino acid ABC transporter substrate-binding protein [Rhodospirillales bacterium]|nr:branched-chain amino acid ABC transporter substrate-binding protein [Rhodospirillales bacterium]